MRGCGAGGRRGNGWKREKLRAGPPRDAPRPQVGSGRRGGAGSGRGALSGGARSRAARRERCRGADTCGRLGVFDSRRLFPFTWGAQRAGRPERCSLRPLPGKGSAAPGSRSRGVFGRSIGSAGGLQQRVAPRCNSLERREARKRGCEEPDSPGCSPRRHPRSAERPGGDRAGTFGIIAG